MKPGCYLVFVLCFALSLSSLGSTHYVDLNSSSPTAPYTNWLTAATNIQDAVDVSGAGDLILVTNGVYKTGSRIFVDDTPCRLVVDKPVTVRSVNGPDSTIIEGFSLSGSFPWSLDSVRCAYLTNGAQLTGFTLTNGSVRATAYVNIIDPGGGVYCGSNSEIISNCVIINCAAYVGGGAQVGTFRHCLITNCVGHFGGGGACSANLDHCEVIWNTTDNVAGGLYYCQATNCNINDNLSLNGGGAYGGTISHCTVYGNYAAFDPYGGGGYAGGVNNADVKDSIMYHNVADTGGDNVALGTFTNCCCPDLSVSDGNITNNPLFMDTHGSPGNFHLQTNSPCINAGKNTFDLEPTDLDGRPRLVGPKTDIGAYEFQDTNTNNYLSWLHNHNLPTDISSDTKDPDADRLTNWQEWRAGTDPTDASSVLKVLSATGNASGINISWQSVTNVSYYLQRSTNLNAPFSSIQSNIVGQAGTTSGQDTGATSLGPYYYRVGVQ
jgi:hypothetical protein